VLAAAAAACVVPPPPEHAATNQPPARVRASTANSQPAGLPPSVRHSPGARAPRRSGHVKKPRVACATQRFVQGWTTKSKSANLVTLTVHGCAKRPLYCNSNNWSNRHHKQ